MVEWLRENGNYRNLLIAILIGFVGWLAVQSYALPDKFISIERYTNDQQRISKTLSSIQHDIKEILRALN